MSSRVTGNTTRGKRTSENADGRARQVSLTPAGQKAAKLVQETWDGLEGRLSAVLSPEQVEELAGLLGLVIEELVARSAGVAEGDN